VKSAGERGTSFEEDGGICPLDEDEPLTCNERLVCVGDQMTHGGQKGFGMTKHGRSGHATRSPRFRFLQKLEAQKNDRKDRSRIKDPKQCVEELFRPRKAT
jgi:hypothetical protein